VILAVHGGPELNSEVVAQMLLSDFIVIHREPILVEWEAFARTCKPASATMDIAALRDHADEMLTVIAADLASPQSSHEQAEKSKGNAQDGDPEETTAAAEHGADRAGSGFTVEQMVSEYRALRASVLRLWMKAKDAPTAQDMEELTRFNEAIDQALAESVFHYTQELENSKEMFLAILGHDLRTPLSAVFTSSRFMLDTNELKEPHLTLTTRIASSSTRMIGLVGDLLDFTRSRLGGGIPVVREKMSMGKALHDVVEEVLAAHPGSVVNLETRKEQRGEWDPARISQALGNLIGNALEHGYDGGEVSVVLSGDADGISIAIHNTGPAIPADRLDGIFNPMKTRAANAVSRGPSSNLGLGLYIAERIVHAHDGRIEVESSDEDGTTFTVHLPCAAAAVR
jgi:signal transduction histidine kinase